MKMMTATELSLIHASYLISLEISKTKNVFTIGNSL